MFSEQRGAKLVPQPIEADIQHPEVCQGLVFAVSVMEPEVFLGPVAELQRLPFFVHRFYFLVGRRRCDRVGPDIHIHKTNGVGPAVYFNILFFCHILPPK
jgi:hypothetical protein